MKVTVMNDYETFEEKISKLSKKEKLEFVLKRVKVSNCDTMAELVLEELIEECENE